MPKSLNITLAQLNPVLGDTAYNRDKILDAWTQSNTQGDDLIVFSELILSGYPPEDLVLKPDFQDAIKVAINKIVAKSSEFSSAALIGCPWIEGGALYNAVHLIENGKITATRYKHHLPNYGVFDEKRVFSAGDLPDPIPFRGHALGVMICEDMWQADVANHLKKQGAERLVVLNGSPFAIGKHEERHDLARARVAETSLPLIYVNQVGGQDELVFDGGSFVMNAKGEITHRMPFFVEDTLSTAIKTDSTDIIDNIDQNELVYNALTLGLSDYVAKNNFSGVLIGLSGGIDSALTAVIAVDALGAENVHCVMMPSQYTSQDSLDDAAQLAKNLGTQLDTAPISTVTSALDVAVTDTLDSAINDLPPITFENIQSRARGVILMALSNATGKMVLTTGNKSEMAVGYATLYGDMCGGFNALKDLYKTQVYALSEWHNTIDDTPVMPERIITKAPTAELKDNQTDQDSLPPYDVLDDILVNLIENEMPIDNIVAKGHDRDTVTRVWRMLDRAEYKRRQAPPGTKITSRNFGRDRRYPITNGFR